MLFFAASLACVAQEPVYKYIDGTELTLLGQSGLVNSNSYHRINSSKLEDLPQRVQDLSKNTAGFNLNFKTNSTSIKLKWMLDEYKILWNMTPLAVNGFDLYGWNGENWQFISSAKPSGKTNEVRLIQNMDGQMRRYKLYFPLYSGIKELQVGVEENATIKPVKRIKRPSVVIYGSSITQGASASRPGMAYPSILARNLDIETFNFGFSGSGKMEIEMARILGKIPSDLFILDCVPNPSVAEIEKRTIPFIKELRRNQPKTPILMVERVFNESAYWDAELNKKVSAQNSAFKEAFQKLKEEGYEKIYYIPSGELIGNDHEATIDGSHFNDLGHFRMADRLSKSIVKILEL